MEMGELALRLRRVHPAIARALREALGGWVRIEA
jgi:hypothetical protein